jgi:hypothetical protein
LTDANIGMLKQTYGIGSIVESVFQLCDVAVVG